MHGHYYVHVQLFDKPRTVFMSANLIVSIDQRGGAKMTNAAIAIYSRWNGSALFR